ncbi:hypothetical protein AVW15_00125 [Chelatococcus daeguensis]|nr:hypothetical protein AVW15_00125 [Chelatococcus daeguensis]
MRIVSGWVLGRKHIPFRPFEVALFDARSAIAMGFDCGPNLLVSELLDARQLRRLLQGLDDERHFGRRSDVFKERPAIRDQLRQRASHLWDRENRECDREPAIGCAEENCSRFLGAIVLEAIHVWMSPSAGWKVVATCLTKSLRHVLRCAAAIAFDPQVLGLK